VPDFPTNAAAPGPRSPGARVGTWFAKPAGMILLGIPVFCITTVLLLALVVREAR
jgi:hypothetical protein